MEIRYVIQNIESGKYISWVNGKGTITYCVKPTTANYFSAAKFAGRWIQEKNLSPDKFKVIPFQVS